MQARRRKSQKSSSEYSRRCVTSNGQGGYISDTLVLMKIIRWAKYYDKIHAVISEDSSLGYATLARKALERIGIEPHKENIDRLRKWIKRNMFGEQKDESTDSSTDTQEYGSSQQMTALHPDTGKVMPIQEYCKHYGLNPDDVTSHKLVSHTGVPYYNVVFRKQKGGVSRDQVAKYIERALSQFKPKDEPISIRGTRPAVHCISDIHIGQRVKKDEMINLKEYTPEVACQKLRVIADLINAQPNSENTLILCGDILEAVQLMHISQYREIDADLTGAKGIKLATQMLHEHLLNRIYNLGKIYLPSSNHGRLGGSNKDDGNRGDAELLIAQFLEGIGYETEYADAVGKFKMGNISFMYTHGQLPLLKKSAAHLIQEFGYMDRDYVCMVSGHTHKHGAETSTIVRNVGRGYIHLSAPAITTGGEYSVDSGFSSGFSGFLSIVESETKSVHYSCYSV